MVLPGVHRVINCLLALINADLHIKSIVLKKNIRDVCNTDDFLIFWLADFADSTDYADYADFADSADSTDFADYADPYITPCNTSSQYHIWYPQSASFSKNLHMEGPKSFQKLPQHSIIFDILKAPGFQKYCTWWVP